MMNFLCFTTLIVVEKDDWFEVLYCGDGYIIKEKLDGTIEFEKIDDGDYPKYYVYNYIDKSRLSAYKDGVTFSSKIFYKDEYKNIGVATDGLRYIFGKDYEEDFVELLKQRKANRIKLLINKEHIHFKDDITIAF
jgi:hypothetical protein